MTVFFLRGWRELFFQEIFFSENFYLGIYVMVGEATFIVVIIWETGMILLLPIL